MESSVWTEMDQMELSIFEKGDQPFIDIVSSQSLRDTSNMEKSWFEFLEISL